MRCGWAWLPWLWACTSCTSPNPAYEGTDEGTGRETAGETRGSTTGRPATSAADESMSEDQGGTSVGIGTSASTDSAAGSSSGDGPAVFDQCRAQLYGVSQSGGLFLIDLDAQAVMEVADAPVSIAVATHPSSGEIYISALEQPNQLHRMGPQDFMVLPAQALPPGEMFPEMGESWPIFSRAAFDTQANLWLGGYTTGHFVRYRDGDPSSSVWFLAELPSGGDMVMLAVAEALVITNDPPARELVFGGSMIMSTMVSVQGLPAGTALTGLAHAGPELWAAAGVTLESPDSMLYRLEATGTEAFEAVDGFYLDVRIDDLAPVIVHPAGC